eukprot:5962079-Pyramimonas_sp.AAC.1
MEELEKAGWNVHGRIHVITVGVWATVPIQNDEVLKEMGVSEKKSRKRRNKGKEEKRRKKGPGMDIGQTRSYDNCAIP